MKKIKKMKIFNKIKNTNLSTVTTIACVGGIMLMLPQLSFAAGPDAFAEILTKANGWVGGSAGKLITFSSLAIAGIMGIAGFPAKHVAGAVGVGLLLSSANSIVNMIF